MFDGRDDPCTTSRKWSINDRLSTFHYGILEGISLADDLVAALPVAVRVVHAMSEVGTSENEYLFITSDFQTAY